MNKLPNCPDCKSNYVYQDGNLLICPECANEWDPNEKNIDEVKNITHDAVGNILQDGDTITLIKDLKVKGSSSIIKVGTKVKNIRLIDGEHDIDCKVDGIGPMKLKSIFVKKI